MKRIIMIFCWLALSSCSSTNHIAFLSLSDQELETVIKDAIPQLSRELRVMNIPVDFKVDNIEVEIGPEQRQVVALNVASTASISAFVIAYPIKLNVALEGNPIFNSEDDAIYLTDVNLVNANIDAGRFKGNLKPLNQQVVSLLNTFLKHNPVYTLNKNNPTESILASIPLSLNIQQGSISLVPSL